MKMRIAFNIAALLLLCAVFAAQADISLPTPKDPVKKRKALAPPPPPEPVAVNVEVRRGGSVEIPLRVFGVPNQRLKYRIRTKPEFGEVSDPVMAAKGVGAVTYRHSGGDEETRDHFFYAAQTEDGVSASVEVNISIVDEAARPGVPEEVDFGTVRIGTPVTKEITIANRGGGVMRGNVSTDEPWQIDGKAAYNLRAGEKQTFKLKLAPQFEQEFQCLLRYSSHPDRTTLLRTVAEAAIAISPRRLRLISDHDAGRAGVLKIANRTSEEQPVRFRMSGSLSGPKRVTVPGGGEISVTFEAAPGEAGPIDEQLLIESPSFATAIPVQAPALGAIVRVAPASVSLGRIVSGRSADAAVQVKNIGGARALVSAAASAPFAIAGANSSFTLEPGEARDVRVSLLSSAEGRQRGVLRIMSGRQQFDVPVEADVTSPPPATALSAPALAAGGPAPWKIGPDAPEPQYRVVPRFDGLRFTSLKPTSCEIAWRLPSDVPLHFKIETLVPSRDGHGKVKLDFVEMTNVAIIGEEGYKARASLIDHGIKLDDLEREGVGQPGAPKKPPAPPITAVIKKLNPNMAYAIRIVPVDASGKQSRPSSTVQFQTPPKHDFTITPLRFLVCALVLLVPLTVGRRIRLKRKQTFYVPKAVPRPKELRNKPVAAGEKDIPMIRELAPGRFEIDYDEA
jgi:hypothetical protein